MIHDDKNDILNMSSLNLANNIKNGKISCSQVIKIFIDQIIKYNDQLNALAYDCFDEAKKIARFYDKKLKNYKLNNKMNLLPKYFGVPIIIKENFEMKNKPNTYGYIFRKDVKGKKNNKYCQKLIENGFIILGAGNLAEGCSWIETNNKIYGRTNNPYDLLRTSGGSSGGTAALITIKAAPFGFCNDALGSIRIPAYYTCLFGHKPSGGCIKGFYSDIKAVKFFDEVAQSGIIARKSEELWPMISLLSETNKIETNKYDNLSLKNIKFVYIGDSFKHYFNNDIDSSLNKSINKMFDKLHNIGCSIQNIYLRELLFSILFVTNNLSKSNDYDSADLYLKNTSLYNNFLDLTFSNFAINFLNKLASNNYETENKSENIIDRIFNLLQLKIEEIFNENENVVLISPTLPNLAPYHDTSIKYILDISMVAIWNFLKLPVTQVPIGLNYQGIPLGIQVIGNKFEDRLTIKVAELLEKEGIAKWIPPKLIQ